MLLVQFMATKNQVIKNSLALLKTVNPTFDAFFMFQTYLFFNDTSQVVK